MHASGVVDTAVLRVTHIPPTPTTGRKDTTTASWGIWGTTMANTTTGWWVANRGWGGCGDTARVTMGRGRATGTRGRRGRDRVATATAQCRAEQRGARLGDALSVQPWVLKITQQGEQGQNAVLDG